METELLGRFVFKSQGLVDCFDVDIFNQSAVASGEERTAGQKAAPGAAIVKIPYLELFFPTASPQHILERCSTK